MQQKRKTHSFSPVALLFCSGLLLADPAYTITDLGTLGGNSSNALSINNYGQIVGSSTLVNPNPPGSGQNAPTHAFIYSNGVMHDLGISGDSVASSINDSGQVVGWSGRNFQFEIVHTSFLYSNGAIQNNVYPWPASDIHSFNRAVDINNNGQILGFFEGAALHLF